MAEERTVLRGSERRPIPDAIAIGSPDPNDLIEVTLILRHRKKLPPPTRTITREEFARRYGADPADVERVEQFAGENDLTVVEVDLGRRSVVLAGTIANMNEAFGTQIQLYQAPGGIFRGRTGELVVPVSIAPLLVGVFGLDDRPQAKTRLRRHVVGSRTAGRRRHFLYPSRRGQAL